MLLGKFKITGHSMEPFLLNNQTVLASSIPFIFSKPKSGDVVVFKVGDRIYIKRVKEISTSPPTSLKLRWSRRLRGARKYFLIGDNKEDSFDGKKFGWIERKDIIGRVVYKF